MGSREMLRQKRRLLSIVFVVKMLVMFVVLTSIALYKYPPSLFASDSSRVPFSPTMSTESFLSSVSSHTSNHSHHPFVPDIKPTATDDCPVQLVPAAMPVNSTKHDALVAQCAYVKQTQGCSDNNFYVLFFCGMQPHIGSKWGSAAVFFLIAFFLTFLFFYVIADTTDVYFSPSIIKIVEYCHIPDAVAGVTLLAFGNGSPDLFSILAGLLSGNTSLALSAPIGAGVFVSGVVFGTVILCGRGGVPVSKRAFLRDVSFYIVSISCVTIIYLLRFTIVYAGLVLISVYITYVVTVVGGRTIYDKCIKPSITRAELIRRARERTRGRRRPNGNGGGGSLSPDVRDVDVDRPGFDPIDTDGYGDMFDDDSEDSDAAQGTWVSSLSKGDYASIGHRVYHSLIKDHFDQSEKPRKGMSFRSSKMSLLGTTGDELQTDEFSVIDMEEKARKEKEKLESGDDKEGQKSLSIPFPLMHASDSDEEKEGEKFLIVGAIVVDSDGESSKGDDSTDIETSDDEIEEVEEVKETCCSRFAAMFGWNDLSLGEKFLYLLFGWYTRFIRNLTTPKSETDEWKRGFACVSPCFGSMFLFFTFFRLMGWFTMEHVWFLVAWFSTNFVLGALVGILVFFTTRSHRPPIYQPAFVVLAFLLSICWIYTSADILVNTLATCGKILNINPSILGLTILAWGNSFPDWVANVIISSKGYPQMAVGACFGEPLLNSLIGVGTLFTWMSVQNLIKHKHPCYPIATDPSLVISFMTLLFQSILSLTSVSIMRFRIRRWYGAILVLVYLISLCLSLAAALDSKHVGWFFGLIKFPINVLRVCPIK